MAQTHQLQLGIVMQQDLLPEVYDYFKGEGDNCDHMDDYDDEDDELDEDDEDEENGDEEIDLEEEEAKPKKKQRTQ